MNDETDNFERRLQNQPVKNIPGAWREEILAAARPLPATRRSLFSTFNLQLSTFLQPRPRAWAALAVAWGFIVVLNFSANDKSSAPAQTISVPATEMVAELKQQRKFYAELMGVNEIHEADQPKNSPARPRTRHTETLSV